MKVQKNTKYQLTSETVTHWTGVKLYRIKALKTFGNVTKGDLGGFVESLKNLDENGNAWVSGNAQVYGNARVSDNAQVSGNAQVYGDAWVYDDARVSDNAQVYGNAWVSGNAQVYGDAWVYDDARVSDNAQVYGNAWVSGNAQVYGDAWVYGDARVSGNAWVYGDARVSGDAQVYGDAWNFSPLQIQGSRHYVNFVSHSIVKIGCYQQTIDVWLKTFEQIGKDNGYTEGQIKEYKLYLDLCKKWLAIYKKDLAQSNKDAENLRGER